jgi:mono/diheme cytochrome c family protein
MHRKPKSWLIPAVVLLFSAISLESCYYDNEEFLYGKGSACDTSNVRYNVQVRAILQSNCTGCHNINLSNGMVRLDEHALVQARANDGSLMGSIRHNAPYVAMPPSGTKLSNCDIAILQAWINQGAPNN